MATINAELVEIAWAAGIFEGEGSWMLHNVRLGRATRSARAKVAMTDRDVVERFHRIVGFGNFYVRHRRAGYKTIYEWRCSTQDVRSLIDAFWPFLGDRRRAKAVELLEQTKNCQKYRRRRA